MKKLTIGTALISVLALTACGETDAREKHMYTVEVEVTDTNGKVQNLKQDCKQLMSICQVKFDLETSSGNRAFAVNSINKPVHVEELQTKSRKITSQDEEDRLTDSEYHQNIRVYSTGVSGFKSEEILSNWKPRTERKESKEIFMPDGSKIADLKIRIF